MTQETIKQRLRAARALIDRPEKWTQGAQHRDAKGRRLDSQRGRPVVARCAAGAIGDACESTMAEWKEVSGQLRNSINRHRFPGGRILALTTWNDHPNRTHAEVMLAFDRAISDATRS